MAELQRLKCGYTPLQIIIIVLHPKYSWFTPDLHDAKYLKLKLERQWKKSRLTVHDQMYRMQGTEDYTEDTPRPLF